MSCYYRRDLVAFHADVVSLLFILYASMGGLFHLGAYPAATQLDSYFILGQWKDTG